MLNYESLLESYSSNKTLKPVQTEMIKTISNVMAKINSNQFLLAITYTGKYEDVELFTKLTKKCCDICNLVMKTELTEEPAVSKAFRSIAFVSVSDLKMKKFENRQAEPLTYWLQPLITFEVLLRPTVDLKTFVNRLELIQKLKNYSNSRLFFELMKASLLLNHNAHDTTLESLYGAFTFIKVPNILKTLVQQSADFDDKLDHSSDIFVTMELLLKNSTVLDLIDLQSSCNNLEALVNEVAKHGLLNEQQVQQLIAKREPTSTALQKLDPTPQSKQPIAKLVVRAEHPLNGVLKSLNSEYGKLQDANHNMLSQMLKCNSCDLIFSVAIMDGKLKQLVSLLIKCNEHSKQANIVEPEKTNKTAELFDVTFLMLVNLVQNYGSDIVLSDQTDSFFEKWVRECMAERNKPKSAMAMVKQCDAAKVDELLNYLRNPESKTVLKWEEICLLIPAALYNTLKAWENDNISNTEAKTILDSLTKRLSAYSVCAGSWLCNYMQVIRQEEIQKAMSMANLIVQTQSDDENVRRKLGLMQQIIRKMQYDIHPAGSSKIRALMHTQNIVSRTPLQDQFDDVWKTINDNGWLSIESAQMLESLLHAGGHQWLMEKLYAQILKCKFKHEMTKTVDIVFAIMHLDIESFTITLIQNIILEILLNNLRSTELVEPYSTVVARLCVYALIVSVEAHNNLKPNERKRQRSIDDDDLSNTASKMMRLDSELSGMDTFSTDFVHDEKGLLSEKMYACLISMFEVFYEHSNKDSLNPNVYFIFQFLSTLIQIGPAKLVKPILRTIPNGLVQNLIKVIPVEELGVGFSTRLYDLESTQGRQSAVSDLCLLQNIKMQNEGVSL